MAAMRRPQLGSAPAQAVLTRGGVGDCLGDTKGVGVADCAFDVKSTTWVMPSPSATIWRASEVQTWVRAAAKAAWAGPMLRR